MQKLTADCLMAIAGTIEKLLIEEQVGIAWAYGSIPDFKLTVTVNLDSTTSGVEANYALSYALEAPHEAVKKRKTEKREIINGNQAALDFVAGSVQEGSMGVG